MGRTRQLPLFPLGMVLFPGLVLPLHVFEERYRLLVQHLLEQPEADRVFGVVAIRSGWEVGEDAATALHDVGCTAVLRRVTPYEDGRFALVTTGGERFALREVSRDQPYLTGDVELLDDPAGDGPLGQVLAQAAGVAFQAYLGALGAAGAAEGGVEEGLPDDPRVLSYAIAATALLDLEDRQALLASTDATTRLRAELALLRREEGFLSQLKAVPSPELLRQPVSSN